MSLRLRMCLRIGHSREDARALEGDLLSEAAVQRAQGTPAWVTRRWVCREALAAAAFGLRGRAHHVAMGIGQFAGELPLALRALRRQPAAAVTLIVTLALGIGANTLGYSVLHALLLAPLPVADEDSLVVVREVRTAEPDASGGVSYLNVRDWRDGTRAFAGLALVGQDEARIRTSDAVVQAEGLTVSASFFSLLGVSPAMGTTFEQWGDFGQTPAGAWPVVLTHRGWQRLFAGDPGIVGRTVEVDGQLAQVVGVTARALFPTAEEPIDYWTSPAALGSPSDASSTNGSRSFRGYTAAIGRLRPGISLEDAQSDLERMNAQLAQSWPRVFAGRQIRVQSLRATLISDASSGAWMLAGLVVLVWGLTCANAINLQLARAAARGTDVAVRRALGGTRQDLIRPVIAENLILALVAGAVGWCAARLIMLSLLPWTPADLPALPGLVPGPSSLWAVVTVSLFTGLLCAVGPAWLVTRSGSTMVTGERASTTLVPSRVRNALLTAQVALALVLLACGGLLANR